MKKLWQWTVVAVLGLSVQAIAEEVKIYSLYSYPSDLPRKVVDVELGDGNGPHINELSFIMSLKWFDSKESWWRGSEVHCQLLDGSELVKTGSCVFNPMGIVRYRIQRDGSSAFTIKGARVGDVYRCYYKYNNGDKSWVSQEFGLRCGGKGAHARCTECWHIESLPRVKGMQERTAARLKTMENGRRQAILSGTPQAPSGTWGVKTMQESTSTRMNAMGENNGMPSLHGASPMVKTVQVQDLIDIQSLRKLEVVLATDSVVYSLKDLPALRPLETIKAGKTVRIVKEISPVLMYIQFIDSSNRAIDGAMRIVDIVPQENVNYELTAPSPTFGDPGHLCRLVASNLTSASFSDMALHCIRQDGVEQVFRPVLWSARTSGNSLAEWRIRLNGAQSGDEYLCFVICAGRTSSNAWISQPFGLRSGANGGHGECADCLSFLPAHKIPAMLNTAWRKKKEQSGADADQHANSKSLSKATTERIQNLFSMPEIENGELILTHDIEVYALDAIPTERLVGHLKAGVTVHLLERLTPTLVHVHFTTSSGKSYEGAMRIMDLKRSATP